MQFDLFTPIRVTDKTNKYTGKRTYTVEDGLVLPSVTTITRELMGSQYNFAYIDKAILEKAKNIGSLVHSEIECFLLHQSELGEIAQIHYHEILKDLNVIKGIELPCFSLWGWAGRCDLLADHPEYGMTVFDWKNTGSKYKKTQSKMRNEMIQVSLYAKAIEETYGVEVNSAVLSIAHYNPLAPVSYNKIELDKRDINNNCEIIIEKINQRGIEW